ncbi:MAG: 4-alpha-glucanotransferase [Betaproteobacteria bacterium]|nr:4-alpha-glucanotransferase [Betaproteobacteria bacterium]
MEERQLAAVVRGVVAPRGGARVNLTLLERACAACGISTEYRDVWGKTHRVPADTCRALLAAMGVAAGSDAELEQALAAREARDWRRVLAPVLVVRADAPELAVPVTLPAPALGRRHSWSLVEEQGARHGGEFEPAGLPAIGERRISGAGFVRFALRLPAVPPPGYHRLEIGALDAPGEARAAAPLIVVPARCYLPPGMANGRVWGPMVNLYALRSERNWGIGDYTDLRGVMELAARCGAAVVGVNPLHALFPHDPEHASPYSPASRQLLNVLYLDPEGVPDFAECEPARERLASAEFQARLRAVRGAERLEYRAVAELKFEILERIYTHFRDRHLARGTERAAAFRAFQQAGGESLRLASLFYALQEHLGASDARVWGWRSWPEPYRDPRTPEVAQYAREHVERTEYHDYLQWNAELQLDAVGKRSLELGLRVGLYQDLAVGVDPGGAEAWGAQSLYAGAVSIGCPPDDFNLKGQSWGLPPLLPDQLTAAAYAPIVALLRENMRDAGALRIDHVMGLMRLFWVPAGELPARGAYVSYPFEDLLGIVALESQRNLCIVIGEDLGTLPDGLAERLRAAGVLSYRLLYFEREPDGAFRAPQRYPAQALAAVSTHDLPTLRGFWQGRDLDLRSALKLFPSEELRQRQIVERAQDRARLLVALEAEKLLPPGASVHAIPGPEVTHDFMVAVHRFLARTPCRLLMVQPEDLFGQLDQVNLPATTAVEHPNWRHRLPLELEQWEMDERWRSFCSALNAERGPLAAPAPAPVRAPDAT